MKAKKVYSTEIIEQIKSQIYQGYNADMGPFFENNINLRAPNINFKLTKEELEEVQRCYEDAVYFVEKYCTFLTDKGRRTVELRDYQKKIIRILTKQKYIPELDDMGPEHRGICMLQSRQSGKCLVYNTLVELSQAKVELGKLFKTKVSFLSNIKNKLYCLYKRL